MVHLRLISLLCKTTEDWGADEPYLLVSGIRVWGPDKMDNGISRDLRGVPLQRFSNKVRISLYDQDSGFLDDDDFLGTTVVFKSYAGKGEQEHTFTGDGARYVLTYEVLA